MEWINIFFGGLGGSLIGIVATILIANKNKTKHLEMAYELLSKLKYLLKKTSAEYYFTKNVKENYEVANLIYTEADAEIISTAFNENPEKYGESDIARNFRYGSLFTRLTCSDICPESSISKCRASLQHLLKGAQLNVIPIGTPFTRIDGMFCRFRDDTYLCLISFKSPKKLTENTGVVFRDGIAEAFFLYYYELSCKYCTEYK